MSINLDDPLAGILSDGSDDSFFDDDLLDKKRPQKKETKLTTTVDKKNSLFFIDDTINSKNELSKSDSQKELFLDDKAGVKNTYAPLSPVLTKHTDVITDFKSKPASTLSDIIKTPSKQRLNVEIDKLGETEVKKQDKKISQPIEKNINSQFSLDDILGKTETNTTKGSVIAPKHQEFNFDTILGKNEQKKIKLPIKDTEKKVAKVEKHKETKKTKSSGDWLGIFKEDNIDTEVDNDMPSWLVGNVSKKTKTRKDSELPKQEHPAEDEVDLNQSTIEKIDKDEVRKPNIMIENMLPIPQKNQLEISQENLTMEGAALCLQQQESQLMVALQLKAQDDKLAAMQLRQKDSQRVQREAVLAQHEQLDVMLRKQAEHRQQMQHVISAHQERITQRIKALLGTSNLEEGIDDVVDSSGNVTEAKDTPRSRERRQLLQLVQSLQENHDKEIDLMETSYRRQLAFLEVSYNQAELRMKEESDKLVRFYTEKIDWLDEHHQLYKKMAEDNLSSLVERHKSESDMLRQQHLENIQVLQEHHAALMENVKNATKQEQVLIKDSAGFSTDLQELLTNVKENNARSEQYYEKVESLTKTAQRDSERSLQIRETQITDMLQQLKVERESFEKEKTERRETENMLEARLRQMTAMIEEESTSLRQKKMDFEFEKATFSKQTEFAKNILKKQDEDFKILKEEMHKEYQEKILKVTEEKAKSLKDGALIAKEKASIQSLKQELEKTKSELQAQLEEIAEERSKINREKQDLHIEEQRVMAKTRDLDLLAKSAIDKQTQADKKYSEAEFLQKKFEDRIRRIQEHVVSLNSREKQIAKEKVALSRERLSLHNERKEIEGRLQCSLCRSTQYTQYNVEQYPVSQTYVHTPASRDYGNRNSINVIEQEMAEFMSRVRRNSNVSLEVEDKMEDLIPSNAPEFKTGAFKDYMDPKFMMLRLDVQQVISNLDQNKNSPDIDEQAREQA